MIVDYSILDEKILGQIFSYIVPNKYITRTENMLQASLVCKHWNNVLKPIIQKQGEIWLEGIFNRCFKNSRAARRLSCFESYAITFLLKPDAINAQLLSYFININSPSEDLLNLLSKTSDKILSIKHFNELLATEYEKKMDVLHNIFNRLDPNECITSVIERDKKEILEILMENSKFNMNENELLQLAIKDKRELIIDYLIQKFPHLADEPTYIRYLIQTNIQKFNKNYPQLQDDPEYIKDRIAVDKNLLFKYPQYITANHLYSFTDCPEKTFETILLHYLNNGNRLSFENFRSLMLSYLFGKILDKKSQLIMNAYIFSNHIENITCSDDENLKKILSTRPLFLVQINKAIDFYRKERNQNLLTRSLFICNDYIDQVPFEGIPDQLINQIKSPFKRLILE